jgi:hypothetical protein
VQISGPRAPNAHHGVSAAQTDLPTVGDPDLRRVAEAWPGLPPSLQAAILAIIDVDAPRRDAWGPHLQGGMR